MRRFGGVYLDVLGRRINQTNGYRARVRFLSNGTVALSLAALRGSSAVQTIAPGVTVPGLIYSPGQSLELRLQVTGTNPTTVRARVWPTGQAEPITWLVSTTESTAALQAAGSVGFAPYVSSSTTNGPTTIGVDNLAVRRTA